MELGTNPRRYKGFITFDDVKNMPLIEEEDTRPVGTRGPKLTVEQLEESHRRLVALNLQIDASHDPSITHNREDIYFDHD